MPYTVKKIKGGYQVLKKDTGEVVAGMDQPLDMKGVKGYIWHSENADKGPINKTHGKKKIKK